MLRIERLRPEHVTAVAVGYVIEWPDWYGPAGEVDALNALEMRASGDDLPLGLVALDGEAVVGAAALSDQSVDSHRHLAPWLVGLWTRPSHRRRGVATRLVQATVRLATERGLKRLYVATHDMPDLFPQPTWRLHEAVEYDSRMLMVFVADL